MGDSSEFHKKSWRIISHPEISTSKSIRYRSNRQMRN